MTAQSCTRTESDKLHKKRKSVVFKKASVGSPQNNASCLVHVHWIPPNSDEDIQARWHSKDEYQEIKNSLKSVVRAAYSNAKENLEVDWDHEDYCIRGLEIISPYTVKEQRERRQRLLAGVWNAQVRQWNEQDRIYDPEAIALASRKQTMTSACIARSFAVRDELAASKYYESRATGGAKEDNAVDTKVSLEEPSFSAMGNATAA
ncbi:unnamed protein product [Cylindrotheca closterium]|uniref:Uncharacterized protein n=1 Tax=Cylindrotheca closterium TaxID=2856 RepID=A0AAD2FNE9_9STRA|nr:unnamed protein product [Cylindrotheca closterium]